MNYDVLVEVEHTDRLVALKQIEHEKTKQYLIQYRPSGITHRQTGT